MHGQRVARRGRVESWKRLDFEVAQKENTADARDASWSYPHPHHRCPPQVGNSVVVAGVRRFFEKQEILSERAELREHSDVMADEISGDWYYPLLHLHLYVLYVSPICSLDLFHTLARHFCIDLRSFHRNPVWYRHVVECRRRVLSEYPRPCGGCCVRYVCAGQSSTVHRVRFLNA